MQKLYKLFILCSCIVLLLSSCSSTPESSSEMRSPLVPISCILVLPAGTSVDKDETIHYQEAQSLEKGAALATSVLGETLAGHEKVRILTSSQLSELVPGVSGGISGTAAVLGEKTNCDAVLVTTVRKFKQREGTDYSVDSPASADVRMVLRHAANFNVLWTADYRETQESFLKNIFSYSKMQKRGFKWITVEELLEQGIKDRLAECPYLQ
ncbi:MAG: hypothetical protein ACN4GW_11240 [Desulforhopalus sp.]